MASSGIKGLLSDSQESESEDLDSNDDLNDLGYLQN
jgi:hypothetical protein